MSDSPFPPLTEPIQAAGAVLGVILAGGQGRRIGGGKALVSLAGRPLAAHVRDRLAPQVTRLVLNANGVDAVGLAGLGLPVIPDPIPGQPGPLAGVLAGMEEALRQGIPSIATAPTDCPFLPTDLVARLRAAWSGGTPVCARANGRRHPTLALWPAALAPALRAAVVGEGMRRMEAALDRFAAIDVAFPADGEDDPFLNINTPDDLAAAERRLAPPVGGLPP